MSSNKIVRRRLVLPRFAAGSALWLGACGLPVPAELLSPELGGDLPQQIGGAVVPAANVGAEPVGAEPVGAEPVGAEPEGGAVLADVDPRLRLVEDCGSILAAMQAGALEQVEVQAARSRQWALEETATPKRIAPRYARSESTIIADYWDPIVQVDDADAPGDAKVDGDSVFSLRSWRDEVNMRWPSALLQRVAVWPAETMQVLASVLIEGDPIGMLVHEGVAVVYSRGSVGGTGMPSDGDLDWRLPSGHLMTKLTVVDLNGPDAVILREVAVDGTYVSAHQDGSVVRTVFHGGNRVPNIAPFIHWYSPFGSAFSLEDIEAQIDSWVVRESAAVRGTEIRDWLPQHYERRGGSWVALPVDCSQHYLPASVDPSRGMSQMLALDLEAPTRKLTGPSVPGLVGAGRSSGSVLMLAQVHRGDELSSALGGYNAAELHVFGLEGSESQYLGSAALPGEISNQLALDEHEGTLRVVTHQVLESFASEHRVHTLAMRGGGLETQGSAVLFGPRARLEEVELEGELLVGDRGYILARGENDVLLVADLSDPENPRSAGELALPMRRALLLPYGEHALLALGRPLAGAPQGTLLQLLDVTDAASPRLLHQHLAESVPFADLDREALVLSPDASLLVLPVADAGITDRLEVVGIDLVAGLASKGALLAAAPALSLQECVGLLLGPSAWELGLWDSIESDPVALEQARFNCGRQVPGSLKYSFVRDGWVFGVARRAVLARAVEDLGGGEPAAIFLPPPP